MGGKQSAIGRRSKNKGSTFENVISKTVCQYFEAEREECYRTPLSGGHPFGDTGDLVIGTKLFKQFPFVVECKAYQDWKPGVMFSPNVREMGWLNQVSRASAQSPRQGLPLLVIKGNFAGIFACLREGDGLKLFPKLSMLGNRLYFRREMPKGGFQRWMMIPWEDFLTVASGRYR
jgi:hypothetical protein